jgi:hypothetical protein
MPGKGIQGRNSLVPRCQCKSRRVKAELPESQLVGVYAFAIAQGELKSYVGMLVHIW